MPKHISHSALAGLVLALIASGCGSSAKKSSSTTGSGTTATSKPASGSSFPNMSVTETEYKLTPAAPSVAAGAVKITVRNAGAVPHALEIENAGAGGKDLRSATVAPGASTAVTAHLKPGKTYVWYCPIDGHRGLGMHGTVTVTAQRTTAVPPPSPAPSSSGTSSGGGSGGSGY